MTFVNTELGCIVLVLESVTRKLMGHSQLDAKSHEAGGVLIGERRGKHLLVTNLSTPQETDLRSRFKFVRHPKGHILVVEKAFNESGGASSYLGEWHTHPEDHPRPSGQDIIGWKLNAARINKETLVIIQGRKSAYAAIISIKGGITELRKIETGAPL